MAKSRAKKQKELIENLKKEHENHKRIFEFNKELLIQKVKLEEANLKNLQTEEKRFNLNKASLEIEIRLCNPVNPIFEFHKDPEWIKKFKEGKEFELGVTLQNWETAQTNFKNNGERIARFQFAGLNTNEGKIIEQQRRIEERLPQIEEQLRKAGVEIPQEESAKQDYIG